jgi:hypothetical protein
MMDAMGKTLHSDSEREWVKLNGRRGSLHWAMRKEQRPEEELKVQTKTLKINVQRATKRRRHISFPENTEKATHRATFSSLDCSKPLLPIGAPKCPIKQAPFISTTALLKRQADAVSSPKQAMQFEDTSSTAVLYTDFRKRLHESAHPAKSQYKLNRPKRQLGDFEVFSSNVETEPTQSMMSMLREAAEIRYEPSVPKVSRRTVVDLRPALSPTAPIALGSGRDTVGLKAQFDVFSFSSEAEKQMGQYRIKTQIQVTDFKSSTPSHASNGQSRSSGHWAWRGKGSAMPPTSS